MARTVGSTIKVQNLRDIAEEGLDLTEELARRRAYSNTINAANKGLDQVIQYAYNSGHMDWAAILEKLRDEEVIPERDRSRALVAEAHLAKAE